MSPDLILQKIIAGVIAAMLWFSSLFSPSVPPLATTTTPIIVASTSPKTEVIKTPSKPLASKPVAIIATTTPVVNTLPITNVATLPTVKPNYPTLNTTLRAATVNIFCTTLHGGAFQPITGSGVIIDPRGIILTNAHVAQYFLLRNFQTPDFIKCVIRTGNPAEPRYTADLLYISPRWVYANAQKITESGPSGNGEHDYALLAITGTPSVEQILPTTFPFVNVDSSFASTDTGQSVVIAGYPADLIGEIATQLSLWMVSSTATIERMFHYGSSAANVDLFSLGGPILSQGGASGGPVMNASTAKVIGIVTLSTVASTTSQKELYALSIPHIDRSLFEETGRSLSNILSFDPKKAVDDFNQMYFTELSSFLGEQIVK